MPGTEKLRESPIYQRTVGQAIPGSAVRKAWKRAEPVSRSRRQVEKRPPAPKKTKGKGASQAPPPNEVIVAQDRVSGDGAKVEVVTKPSNVE